MVRQALDLLGQAVGSEAFEGLDDVGVEHATALLKQTPIRHLVCQSMLEGVDLLGEQPRLVEELSSLQMGEATVQGCLSQLSNGLQQRQGHLSTNDCGSLEESFLLRWQPVNARRQHHLYCDRHLNRGER